MAGSKIKSVPLSSLTTSSKVNGLMQPISAQVNSGLQKQSPQSIAKARAKLAKWTARVKAELEAQATAHSYPNRVRSSLSVYGELYDPVTAEYSATVGYGYVPSTQAGLLARMGWDPSISEGWNVTLIYENSWRTSKWPMCNYPNMRAHMGGHTIETVIARLSAEAAADGVILEAAQQ